MAGATPELCFFTNWGDTLALTPLKSYNPDDIMWLYQEVQGTQSPGAKLSSFIKAIRPGTDVKTYKDVVIMDTRDLPTDAVAGGIRPGACNELMCCMPVDIAVHTTGHELKGFSAFHEYIDSHRAMLMPGAIVLAGFPALPWGQMAKGPVPATLAALPHLNRDKVQAFLGLAFNIDSSSPPEFHIKGELRPALEASLASLILWYTQRYDAGDMHEVAQQLCWAYCETWQGRRHEKSDYATAHATLQRWSKSLQDQFKADNLALSSRCHSQFPSMTPIVEVLRVILDRLDALSKEMHHNSTTQNASSQTLTELSSDVATLTVSLKQLSVLETTDKLDTLLRAYNVQPPPGVSTPATSAQTPRPPGSTCISTPMPNARTPVVHPENTTTSPPSSARVVPAPNALALLMMPPTPHPLGRMDSLSGVAATTLYTKYMLAGGHTDGGGADLNVVITKKKDRSRVKWSMEAYNAMATTEEKKKLRDKETESGVRKKLVEGIHDLVAARIRQVVTENSLKLPNTKGLAQPQPGKEKTYMLANSYNDILANLNKQGVQEDVWQHFTEAKATQNWRQSFEAQAASALPEEPGSAGAGKRKRT